MEQIKNYWEQAMLIVKKEVDIEEEVQRLSRKTNINIKKAEYSYSKQLERLDKEMDKLLNQKIKDFDDNKKVYNMVVDYLKKEKRVVLLYFRV